LERQALEMGVDLFQRQGAVARRQKARVRALLDRQQVHKLQSVLVSRGTKFDKDLSQNIGERPCGFTASEAQGMLAAGAHQQAFHLVAPYSQFSSSGREILQAEWEFELLGHGHEQLTATCGVLGRKKRNVHIQSALPFQVNLEQVGPAGGEYPQDLPTVAG